MLFRGEIKKNPGVYITNLKALSLLFFTEERKEEQKSLAIVSDGVDWPHTNLSRKASKLSSTLNAFFPPHALAGMA